MLWYNFHKVWNSASLHVWVRKMQRFLPMIRHVTLWPWLLTPWPWTFCCILSVTWSKSVQNLSEIEQFPTVDDSDASGVEAGIRISQIYGWSGQFWFWSEMNFNNSANSAVLCRGILPNFTAIGQRYNVRLSYWRFSTLLPSNFRGLGHFLLMVLRGAWTELH